MPSSVIFFANKSLPASCVDLGRFVLNLDMPWEDYCPDSGASQEEARVAPDPQLYPIIEAGVQRGAKIDMGFIRSTDSVLGTYTDPRYISSGVQIACST
jgi:hypothetical protein